MARIVAAMSGGVDSSVAAALLAREAARGGDEVVGVWMRTHPDRGEGWEPRRGCCSTEAADDARRVAQQLGIPFYILNVEQEFGEQVIDAFADAYLAGTTPNPCQACNEHIKFDLLVRRAVWRLRRAGGGDRPLRPDRPRRTGAGASCGRRTGPRTRPTSCGTSTSRAWPRTRFPLGDMTKTEVRRDRPRSRASPRPPRPSPRRSASCPPATTAHCSPSGARYEGEPGAIVDESGSAGRDARRLRPLHRGSAPRAWASRSESPALRARDSARVQRGGGRNARRPRRARLRRETRGTSWPGRRRPSGSRPRSASGIERRTSACEVTLVGTDRMVVETADPVWAPAPGQSAVLYRGEECLGGGRIART